MRQLRWYYRLFRKSYRWGIRRCILAKLDIVSYACTNIRRRKGLVPDWTFSSRDTLWNERSVNHLGEGTQTPFVLRGNIFHISQSVRGHTGLSFICSYISNLVILFSTARIINDAIFTYSYANSSTIPPQLKFNFKGNILSLRIFA